MTARSLLVCCTLPSATRETLSTILTLLCAIYVLVYVYVYMYVYMYVYVYVCVCVCVCLCMSTYIYARTWKKYDWELAALNIQVLYVLQWSLQDLFQKWEGRDSYFQNTRGTVFLWIKLIKHRCSFALHALCWMPTCICLHIRKFSIKNVSIHTPAHTHTYAYNISRCVVPYFFEYTLLKINTGSRAFGHLKLDTCMCTYKFRCICVCLCVYICMYTCVYIRAHANTYTVTYIHAYK